MTHHNLFKQHIQWLPKENVIQWSSRQNATQHFKEPPVWFFFSDARTLDFFSDEILKIKHSTAFINANQKGSCKMSKIDWLLLYCAHENVFLWKMRVQLDWCCFVESSRYTVPTEVFSCFDIETHCEDSVLNSFHIELVGIGGFVVFPPFLSPFLRFL